MPLTSHDFTRDEIGHGCFAFDLDGEVQSFVPSIRDRLIERGVLKRDNDGIWHLAWRGCDLEKERAADMACCDFCGRRPVTWLVPCETFKITGIPGPPQLSHQDWSACETCGGFISQWKKESLLAHVLNSPPTADLDEIDFSDPVIRKIMRDFKKKLHRQFWQHYKGGATRVTPHPYGH